MKYLAWPLFVVGFAAALYSIIAHVYVVWVITATRPTAAELAKLQLYAKLWLAAAATIGALAIIDLVYIVRRYRSRAHPKGFDVVTDAPAVGGTAAR